MITLSGGPLKQVGTTVGLLIAISTYFVALLITAADGRGLPAAWGTFGVAALPDTFKDLGVVALASRCRELDPADDPYNSLCAAAAGYSYNYPRLWLYSNLTGLKSERLSFYGWLLTTCFGIAALAILRPNWWWQVIYCTFAFCSPAIMLGIERGNTDEVIFITLTVALYLLNRQTFSIRMVGYFLVLLAAFLKLYPLLALIVVIKETRRNALVISTVCTVLFALYLGVSTRDTAAILRNTPVGVQGFYGSRVLMRGYLTTSATRAEMLKHAGRLDQLMLPQLFNWIPPASENQKRWGDAVAIVFFMGVSLLVCMRSTRDRSGDAMGSVTPLSRDSFRVGSVIYISTYLLSMSWQYRMAFLLLVIPALWRWSRLRHERLGTLATGSLTLLILCLWVPRGPLILITVAQLLDACLCFLLLGLFTQTFRFPKPTLARLRESAKTPHSSFQ